MSSVFPDLIALTLASVPAPLSARIDGPIFFDRLSIEDAHKLSGSPRRFIVAISTPAEPLSDGRWYGCFYGGKHLERTVMFELGAKVDEDADYLLVEGQVCVIHRAWKLQNLIQLVDAFASIFV
jgi:hypothetical protein